MKTLFYSRAVAALVAAHNAVADALPALSQAHDIESYQKICNLQIDLEKLMANLIQKTAVNKA